MARTVVAGIVPLVAAVLAWPAAAQQPASESAPAITEWTVPWDRTRPRDPYADRNGKVWFVGQVGDYVGVLDPATGAFRRFDLDPGTGPHNLIVDPAGTVWFTGNLAGFIGKLDPQSGRITRYPMPDSAVRDPHTMVFDSHGDIWFTAQAGNVIGKLTVASGEVRLVRVPTPGARPYGIVVDRSDRPWAVLFGTNRIATVDPATFRITEFPLPRAAARPRRLTLTSDGAIWYGDYIGGMLGRFDPVTHQVQEWTLPDGPRALPYAVMADDRDRVWVVETGPQPNLFVGFDTRALRFVPGAPVPGGGGAVRHMMFDAERGVLWFGTDVNTIGRARVSAGRATP
jgi:virginiamycin B lyase